MVKTFFTKKLMPPPYSNLVTLVLPTKSFEESNTKRVNVAKAWVHMPGQSSKMKYEKVLHLQLLLSRFLAKTLRVNKSVV